jgi:hypothetical protein
MAVMIPTLASRPPGPWDANAAPTLTPIDVPTRNVNQRSAPSDAAFGDRNQAARNAAARVDAEAERATNPRGAVTKPPETV